MLRYLIRRLLWAFVLFVAVTIVTYIIFYAVPAAPARLACGQRATTECVKRAAKYLGTDRPLYVQYAKFFGRLMPFSVRGGPHLKEPSLGRSFTNRQSVNYTVGQPPSGSIEVDATSASLFPGTSSLFSASIDPSTPGGIGLSNSLSRIAQWPWDWPVMSDPREGAHTGAAQ